MYAVIKTGGKQYKVAAGDVIEVERLKIKGDDPTLTLTPLFVVDDDGKAISGADKLADFKVGVKVVGDTKGDKITVFKYRNKSGYASKTGHRQQYSMIEITSIGSEKPKKADKAAPAAKSDAPDSDTVDN
jgi:large subunit ribosomal protein L21